MQDASEIFDRYLALRERQQFDPSLLDDTRIEAHRQLLTQISLVKNSAITVFDMHKGEHVFASDNFSVLLGYDTAQLTAAGNNAYFDARVHPEDLALTTLMGLHALEFLYEIEPANRKAYKFVSEYRVLGRDDRYVRIIEQHQVLELDPLGNLWLTMSTVDLSPRQALDRGVECAVFNFYTGEVVPLDRMARGGADPGAAASLSLREREILLLIQRGHLSKEISELLSISVHTVNTHRQRILQKLDADNSMEAVQVAQRLGLLG